MKFMANLLEEFDRGNQDRGNRRRPGMNRGRDRSMSRDENRGRDRSMSRGRDNTRRNGERVRQEDDEFNFDLDSDRNDKRMSRDRMDSPDMNGGDYDMDSPDMNGGESDMDFDMDDDDSDIDSPDMNGGESNMDFDDDEGDLSQRVDGLEDKLNELLQKLSMYMSDKVMDDDDDMDFDDDMNGDEPDMTGSVPGGEFDDDDDLKETNNDFDDDEFDLGPLDDEFDDDEGWTAEDREERDQQARDEYYDRPDVRRGERFDDEYDRWRNEY